jgi:hypothetical protein
VLNERSLPEQDAVPDDDMALGLVEGLADVLNAARRIRPDLALVSPVGLVSHPVTAEGLTFGDVAHRKGGRVRDQWTSVLRALSRAPFQSIPGHSRIEADEEYHFDDEPAIGLGFAQASGQLAVSLRGDRWDRAAIALVRHWIEETAGGGVVWRREDVTARHAMTIGHVEEHSRQIQESSLPDPFSGADLWADRERLYPHLSFLPQVEKHLRAISAAGTRLRQVSETLWSLDDACSRWPESTSGIPHWRSLVSREHEQRRHLCLFEDLDGTVRCFDWHARFTPGAGRIHFRLTAKSKMRRAIVAHIGDKLAA